MYRIAVIGDADSIRGFAAVGLDIFPCETPEQATAQLKKMSSGEYGVIYLTEAFACALERELKKYDEKPLPVILPIPGVRGNTGIGQRRLREAVEKAVGSDIIFND